MLFLICVYVFCCFHKLISCFKTDVYSFTLYSFYCLRLIVHNTKGRIILKTTSNLASLLRFGVDSDFTNHTEIAQKWPNFNVSWALLNCKRLSASGGLRPLTLWPGALPLNPAGGSAPDPHYRLALRARHKVPWKLFDNSTTGHNRKKETNFHET